MLQEKIECLKSVFPFYVFPFVRYKILLRFSIILYFASPYFVFFFGGKDDVLFPNAAERTFSLLTCHLQLSITARVSMTLKRQSVQISDQKTARTLFLRKPRTCE